MEHTWKALKPNKYLIKVSLQAKINLFSLKKLSLFSLHLLKA